MRPNRVLHLDIYVCGEELGLMGDARTKTSCISYSSQLHDHLYVTDIAAGEFMFTPCALGARFGSRTMESW